jgi:hypothetical protein
MSTIDVPPFEDPTDTLGLARILLITTLIHGVPFFIRAYKDHTLAAEWAASKAYWTGVVAWFILLWMVISSLIPFRYILHRIHQY